MAINYTDNITALDAVGATTTSSAYDISKRNQVSLQFISAGGDSTFTVDVSNDGTNWVTGVAFLDALQTSVGTYVVSKAVSGTTAGAILTPGFRYVRVKATYTSGAASCVLQTAG
jgi:uncharacterized repeat protein (TIGR01451 family)